MIIAVGHDIVEIDRVRRLLQQSNVNRRLFNDHEVEYCQRHKDPAPSFAARFAAKEAFQKVWPRPHGWREVWVYRPATPDGPFPYASPSLRFSAPIQQEMASRGWRTHLSLTHSNSHAAATVILEQWPDLGSV